jgi:ribosomal protein S18 acetylase RimI-like enzyme
VSIVIREATLSDLEAVQHLNHDLFISDSSSDPLLNLNWPLEKVGKEYFRKKITQEKGICFVADDGGEVIGYVAGSITKEIPEYRPILRAEIENIIVKSEHRSKGVGAELVKTFINWCRDNKVVKLHVEAYSPNKKAIEFYKKMGFEPFALDLEQSV